MRYNNIDYSKFLSIDNGKGILLSNDDVLVLNRYGFDFYKYGNIKDLLLDLDNFLDNGDVCEELEEILQKLNEIYYYNCVNKQNYL